MDDKKWQPPPCAAQACNPQKDKTNESAEQALIEGTQTKHPSGTVLLSTRMLYGVISYEPEDVKVERYESGRRWQLSPEEERTLTREWKSTPFARLELVTDKNGVVKVVVKPETTNRSTFSRVCRIS